MSMSYRSKPTRPPPPKSKAPASGFIQVGTSKPNPLLEQGNPLFSATSEECDQPNGHRFVASTSSDSKSSPPLSSTVRDDYYSSSDDELFKSFPTQPNASSLAQSPQLHPIDYFDSSSDESCPIVEDHYGTEADGPCSDPVNIQYGSSANHSEVNQSGEEYVESSSASTFQSCSTSEVPHMNRDSPLELNDTVTVMTGSRSHAVSPSLAPFEENVEVSLRDIQVPTREVLEVMSAEQTVSHVDLSKVHYSLSAYDIAVLSVVLYFYYSFMSVSYISGFFAGVLVFFLLLTTFIAFLSYYEDIKRRLAKKKWEEMNMARKDEIETTLNITLGALLPLKSERFSLAYDYNVKSRSSSQMYPVRMLFQEPYLQVEIQKIYSNDSEDARQFWQFGEDAIIEELNAVVRKIDLRHCSMSIVPAEVASDRKRRWSKKYPVCLHVLGKNTAHDSVVYLFVSVARDKEEWYRRMWNVCRGSKFTEESIQEQSSFFKYVAKYVPRVSSFSSSPPSTRPAKKSLQKRQRSSQNVQLSRLHAEDDPQDPSLLPESLSTRHSDPAPPSELSKKPPVPKRPALQSLSSVSVDNYHLSLSWVNLLASRICWDFWHKKKWKQWVMKRIDKKLQRIQRPAFLEELHVTDVYLGTDMPQIKRIVRKPKVDHRGVWAYLDVSYRGSFTMTIETKVTAGLFQDKHSETKIRLQTLDARQDLPSINDDDSDSEPEERMVGAHQPKVGSPAVKRGKKLRSYMNSAWKAAANSKLGKRVTEKVTEKVLSYPLILSVEVRRVDGSVVINIPPPPSDSIWYGFESKPFLSLSAKPKVFNREVTFSYVTDWIEKKLVELVEKKLVHPNMLDFTVTPLDSGIPGDESVAF